MRSLSIAVIAALILSVALTACNAGLNTVPAVSGNSSSLSTSAQQWGVASRPRMHPTAAQLGLWPFSGPAQPVCGSVPAGYARCAAWIRTDIKGMLRSDTPAGYAPLDLQTAYRITQASRTNGNGKTVAVVVAYHYPNVLQDGSVYRNQYGLCLEKRCGLVVK